MDTDESESESEILYPANSEDITSAKRLCYVGSVLGNEYNIAKDGFVDIWDFPPEMFEKANMDGLPHRGLHSTSENGIIGKIVKTVEVQDRENGAKTKHVFGYIDMDSMEGKIIAQQMISGGMRELSLNHKNIIHKLPSGGFVESKLLTEISSTNKGKRGPGFRVNFAAYDSTLNRLSER